MNLGFVMRTVVVYESMFGNSHKVADAICAGLSEAGPVDVVPVSGASAELVMGADLLVVGGPTHVHSMSSRKSRKSAEEMSTKDAAKHDKPPPSMDPNWQDPGLRDWIKALPHVKGQFAAAFDTRLDARALVTGRASRLIARKLKRHGRQLIAAPESFLVDSDNVILDSELARAENWAAGLGTAMTADPGTRSWEA